MVLDFYYTLASPPCRGPMLTAKALGVDLNLKDLNLREGEHLKPEFLAINPQHKVPTLVDGDFILWESKAIAGYLVAQYGKDDSLYPTDPKKRAVIDKFLYFDASLQAAFFDWVVPVIRRNAAPDDEKKEKIVESLSYLNDQLKRNGFKFVCGDSVSIADQMLVANVTTFSELGIDVSKHPQLEAWLQRCAEAMPGYEDTCLAGAKILGNAIRDKLAKK